MPLLDKDIREGVREHIILNCKEKEIFLQSVNGYEEHLHALISLGKNQTIAKVVQDEFVTRYGFQLIQDEKGK
jgi:putative transposase